MLLASFVDYDTRVKKEAVSLAQSGCLVTIVARSADAEHSMTSLHGVRVIKQPVDLVLHSTDQKRSTGSPGSNPLEYIRNRWRRGLSDREALKLANSMTARTTREVESLQGRMTKTAARSEYRRRSSGHVGGSSNRVRLLILRLGIRLGWPLWLATGDRPRVVWARRRSAVWTNRLEQLSAPQATTPALKGGRSGWQKVLPYLVDTEIAFAQYFDRFPPSVIHCHDFFTLPMAVHARQRAFLKGMNPKIVYDSHELVTGLGGHYSKEIFASYVEIEETYVNEADAIVTVSEAVADRLVDLYQPARRPVVVHNAPPMAARAVAVPKSVRELLSLEASTPIGVYIGSVNPKRGIDLLIAAMPKVPDFHVAIAATRLHSGLEATLLELAEETGVADRIHLVDPVEPHEVVSYIGDADVGLILSSNDVINHQVALSNKLFEYLHAGLPIVTSNCAALEDFVNTTGVGDVFRSDDADDLARVLQLVLTNSATYRACITDELLRENSWETSQAHLIELYSDLVQQDLNPNPPHPVRLKEEAWAQ